MVCLSNLINFIIYTQTKRIMSLDIGLLMAGTKERGELEARVTTLISDILKSGDNFFKVIFWNKRDSLSGSFLTCFCCR